MKVDISKPLKSIDSDVAQVCEDGHVVNWFSREATSRNRDFCPECGKKTQTQCSQCGDPIEGGILHLGLIDPDSMRDCNNVKQQIIGWDKGKSIPDHCGKCGQAFPLAGKQPHLSSSSQPKTTAPVFINNSPGANVNLGSGNIHQQVTWVKHFNQKIEKANASVEEKQKAKSILEKISENKLLNTILGAAVGELTKAALPK